MSINTELADLEKILGEPIAYYPAFTALGASAEGALYLSQALACSEAAGETDGWFTQTEDEWEKQTGLDGPEQRKVREILSDVGVLEMKRAGDPARLHFRADSKTVWDTIDCVSPPS